MPHLNWREYPYPLALSETKGAIRATQTLTVPLNAATLAQLLASLTDLFEPEPRGELRVSLPDEWLFFFKPRPATYSDSLLLIAHPGAQEWVATIALTPAHFGVLKASLAQLPQATRPLRLLDLFPVGATNNLDLIFKLEN